MRPMRCWDAQVFPEWYRQGKAEAEPATESSSWLSPLNHSYVGCLGKRHPTLMDAQNQGLGTTWNGGLSVRNFMNLGGPSLSSANVLSGVSHRHQCAPGGLDSMPGSSRCSSETLSRPVIPPTSGVRVNADTELTLSSQSHWELSVLVLIPGSLLLDSPSSFCFENIKLCSGLKHFQSLPGLPRQQHFLVQVFKKLACQVSIYLSLSIMRRSFWL